MTPSGEKFLLWIQLPVRKSKGVKLESRSTLRAALDTIIRVDKRDGDREGSWSLEKRKDDEGGHKAGFQLEPTTVTIDAEGDPVTTCIIQELDRLPVSSVGSRRDGASQYDAAYAETIAVLMDEGRSQVDTASLSECFTSIAQEQFPDHSPEALRKALGRLLKKAVEAGELRQDGEGITILGPP